MLLNLLNYVDHWSDVSTGNDSSYLPLGIKEKGMATILFSCPHGERMIYFNIPKEAHPKCFLTTLGMRSRE